MQTSTIAEEAMNLAVPAVETSSRAVVSITIISSVVGDLITTVVAVDSCRIVNRVAQKVVTCRE